MWIHFLKRSSIKGSKRHFATPQIWTRLSGHSPFIFGKSFLILTVVAERTITITLTMLKEYCIVICGTWIPSGHLPTISYFLGELWCDSKFLRTLADSSLAGTFSYMGHRLSITTREDSKESFPSSRPSCSTLICRNKCCGKRLYCLHSFSSLSLKIPKPLMSKCEQSFLLFWSIYICTRIGSKVTKFSENCRVGKRRHLWTHYSKIVIIKIITFKNFFIHLSNV